MITAENYIVNKAKSGIPPTPSQVECWIIEFAKMHVSEALKQANLTVHHAIVNDLLISENTIINAYPLENIK